MSKSICLNQDVQIKMSFRFSLFSVTNSNKPASQKLNQRSYQFACKSPWVKATVRTGMSMQASCAIVPNFLNLIYLCRNISLRWLRQEVGHPQLPSPKKPTKPPYVSPQPHVRGHIDRKSRHPPPKKKKTKALSRKHCKSTMLHCYHDDSFVILQIFTCIL